MQRLARLSRFDALNRVRTKAVPVSTDGVAGYSVVYGYDVRGLQTSAQFGSGAGITNKFDGFGRPWVSTSNMDGVARSVEWTYITAEGRTQIKHPDGQVFEYAYEATDNLSFVYENGPGSELIKNSFDAFGRRELISRNTGGGSTTTISFDNISRLGSLGHNFDGAATGNDVGIGFSYNPASQVVGRSQTNSSYDYQIPSANQVYTSNGRNQIAQITGTGGGTIGWDANGNLTSDGLPTPTTYTYDAENRLVSSSGAKTATLTYDPMGRLYQVSDAAGAQRFLYDGDRLILEYNGSGVVQRRYAHGAGVDEPIVWHEGAGVSWVSRRYLHADHQGSIINVTDAAGSTLLIGAYDAYGVTTSNTGRFQYTGQTAITQVGLYYYKARFYNPSLGRFMQTDPIGYDDDVNLYTYVRNDPLNRADPAGLEGVSYFDDLAENFDPIAEAAAASARGVYIVGGHGGLNATGQYLNVGNIRTDGKSDQAFFGTSSQMAKIVSSGYKSDMPLMLMYCRAATQGNAAEMARNFKQAVVATEGYVGYRPSKNGVITYTAGSGSQDGKLTGSATFSIYSPNGGRVDGLKSISVDEKSGSVTAVAESSIKGSRLTKITTITCTLQEGCK